MTTLKVLWPYITLRVASDTGGTVLREFYAGAPVPEGADQDDVDRLVRKGALVEADSTAGEFLAVPAGTPIPGEPPNVPVTEAPSSTVPLAERVARIENAAGKGDGKPERPHGNANKQAWEDYAVAQRDEGVSEQNAREQAKASTKDELIAKYGKR